MTVIWCMVPEIWSTTEFFVILGRFLPFYPAMDPENQNFEKMKKKKTPEDIYHFTNVYHKWQSYDVWFLRYGVQWTEFFVILDYFLSCVTIFCPFIFLTARKINILKIWKNAWRYYHFTHVYHKWQSYDV